MYNANTSLTHNTLLTSSGPMILQGHFAGKSGTLHV
jgi:hypothetical protein